MSDLAMMMRAVVLPAVESVFKQGEITSLELHVEGDSVYLKLTAVGEAFLDHVVQAGVPDQSDEGWCNRLRSNLLDFVAESRFGWGQDRR